LSSLESFLQAGKLLQTWAAKVFDGRPFAAMFDGAKGS